LRAACRAHVPPHDGCSDQPIDRKTAKHFNAKYFKQEKTMTKKSRFVSAAIALATLAGVSLATAPANAAVVVRHAAYVNPSAGVAVNHYGYTRVTPYGVKHVGYTRVWR
jgi:hypothetical protein